MDYDLPEIVERVYARFHRRWPNLDPTDAKQEALITCLRRADQWNGALSSAPTYFSMVARHAIEQAHIKETKHARRSALSLDVENSAGNKPDFPEEAPEDPIETAEIASRVRCVVSSLPPLIQDLIAADGDPGAKRAIVEAAGISRQAGDKRVKQALAAATRHLRRLI